MDAKRIFVLSDTELVSNDQSSGVEQSVKDLLEFQL